VTLEHALWAQGLLPPGLEFDAGAPKEERQRSRAALTAGLVRLVDLVSVLETRFRGRLRHLYRPTMGILQALEQATRPRPSDALIRAIAAGMHRRRRWCVPRCGAHVTLAA
jgi:hypothetical protein